MEKTYICINKKECCSENAVANPRVIHVIAKDENDAKMLLKSSFSSREDGWLLTDDWYLIEEDYAKKHIAYAETTK